MLRDERIQEIRSRIEACGPRHCEACKMLDEVLLSQAELKRENERLRSTLWCIRATTMEKEIANICNEALASPPSQADRTQTATANTEGSK